MKTIVVTGTTAGSVIWTPFGLHQMPGVPVSVTLVVDSNGLPISVIDVKTGIQAGPIA